MTVVIDPNRFGVTFSAKQCRNFQIDPAETVQWLIDRGFRRFRLMSYWNEHEKEPGNYDFKALDEQIDRIEKAGCSITLCLGARQPRWPENHWPEWAWKADKETRSEALLTYLETVVKRYRNRTCIISYQLENEAVLQRWGDKPEVDRERLRAEYASVKKLDPTRPVIMTTSTSWGIPARQPIPDSVGFSFYSIIYRDGAYHRSVFYPWVHRLRKWLIWQLLNRRVFIHELQLEPWGPTAIWKMDAAEQAESMSVQQIKRNVELAKRIHAYPIDLWGGEWWYWRSKHGDDSIWEAVKGAISAT
jgi:hypothetical protein